MQQPQAKTTLAQIQSAITLSPDGPIVLWHYTSAQDPTHIQNGNKLRENCPFMDEYLSMGESTWRLVLVRVKNSAGGFVKLEKCQPRHRARQGDPVRWWQEQLIKKGLLGPAHQSRTPVYHPTTTPPEFGYDFGQEEGDG